MTGPRDLNAQIESLINRLRRRQVVGSWCVSIETAMLLRQVVSTTRWNHVETLIKLVKEDIGKRLVMAQPRELAVGNIVRRVLCLIRDVYNSEVSTFDDLSAEDDDKGSITDEEEEEEVTSKSSSQKTRTFSFYGGLSAASMINLLGDGPPPLIISEIQEMINELENTYVNIVDQAMEHIHSNEIIMTVGKSRTVEMFLKTAAKKRKFSVLVAETFPTYLGHEMALSLSQAGIDTTVISDSAIFAVMSRVNKVIMGTHAVLANGGLISVSGAQMVATAAKHHSKPVVVCTGLYKLSPLYPYDEDSFNDLVAPDPVLSFNEGKKLNVQCHHPTCESITFVLNISHQIFVLYIKGDLIDKVTLLNPYYDYVSPELVSLFITNTGGHPPSYLYRLINENYDPDDTPAVSIQKSHRYEKSIELPVDPPDLPVNEKFGFLHNTVHMASGDSNAATESLTLPEISNTDSNTNKSNLFERQLLLLLKEKIPSNDKEVFVTGVEIYEYHDFDTNLLNIYISKVDTTGYRPCSSTPTKNLLTAYIKFYLEETNVNRQLLLKRKTIKFNIFARPHPQYLFHLSEKNPTKRILSDSELLKWWKNVLQRTFLHDNTMCNAQEKTLKKRGWYFFPGMSSEKLARTFIKDIVNDEAENHENLFWQYGYPYPDTEEAIKVIPRFEDDAKTRWLETARESSLTVKNFWELISIGGEFAGGKQAGFFWVDVALEDDQGLASQDIETIPFIDQSFNTRIKKELEKEVGGVVVSAHTYIQALGELFAQEFHSEEAAIESTSYWCRYFTGLQDKINPDSSVIKFTVNNSTITHNDGQKLNNTPVNNLQMHVKRKASSTVQNDNLNSKIDSNVNVLPLSSIKRVKK
ncbi:24999_t:CDS:10 [Cetraspora pellucida]|uniref:Translation initiation factor eIF2B subunit beta n=1 Tax=Cetraspora pellucida TaxID=1433469 RepID=A0A9N9D8U7_9GLOM|nr:24999_t:CDS:10 [Cetraspora pellucida]